LRIEFNAPPVFCPGETAVLEAQIIESPEVTGVPAYTWYEDGIVKGSGSGIYTAIIVEGGKTYRLEATLGCTAEAEKTVDIVDISIQLPDKITICPGEQLRIPATVNSSSYTIRWTKQGESDYGPVPLPPMGNVLRDNPTERTIYTAYYENNGCLNTASIEVDIYPVPDTIRIQELEPKYVKFIPEGGMPPYLYAVDQKNNFSSSDYSEKLRIGNHIVYVRDDNECGTSQKFTILEELLVFPPFFSPESEIAANRVWKIKNLDVYDQIDFQIHDRYGKVILTATTPEKAQWDGKYNGKLMPSTDYWYVLKIKEIGKEYIGHFTLIHQGIK